ncbi:MAG TPA: type II secretion system minor pseudopilin GspK [Nitrospira sp.]|nr:type II secretion system minor pseudopilin GspK [Nitrospira sp.]
MPRFESSLTKKPDERGVALLLALLVLALLVALILEFDTESRREYRDAAAFRDNFKATVLSRAAVQAARAVLQQDFIKDRQKGQFYDGPTDVWAFPIRQYAIGDGFLDAQIEDELGKFNLNDLAAGGDPNAQKIKIFRIKRLFELVQVNPELVDAIVDWIDPDEVPQPAGAESLYYQNLKPPYRAANAPLQTLRELRLVKGMTADSFDRISRFVTVYPVEGGNRINLNTADTIVLQALDPRITQAVAGEIIVSRPYKTIQELDRVGSFEAVGKELRLQNAYDVKSNVFSARMTLTINEVVKHPTVVLLRDQNTGSSAVLYFRIL